MQDMQTQFANIKHNGWLVSFDNTHAQHIYADDLSEVLDYIKNNQAAMFGHDGVRHLKLEINQITEDESDAYFSKGIVPQSWL